MVLRYVRRVVGILIGLNVHVGNKYPHLWVCLLFFVFNRTILNICDCIVAVMFALHIFKQIK